MMTVAELLARARAPAGKGIKYRLGSGGMNPVMATPANYMQECDCSGYVCWSLGISPTSKSAAIASAIAAAR